MVNFLLVILMTEQALLLSNIKRRPVDGVLSVDLSQSGILRTNMRNNTFYTLMAESYSPITSTPEYYCNEFR